MSEVNDDGDTIFGPQDAEEGLLSALVNYALWTGKFRHKGEEVWGYLVVNNHTGIVECEGSNMPNSIVAMYYLERRYMKVMKDPEAEMDRQSRTMEMVHASFPFGMVDEDDDDDGSRH